MFGNMQARAFCIDLQYKFGCHLSIGAPSRDGLAIIDGYITKWQMGMVGTSAVPYTNEQFLDVLDGITRPVTTLQELHQEVFPTMDRYYTTQQVDTLTRALLDRVLRVITAPGYVWLYKTAKKRKQEEEEQALPAVEAMEMATEVLATQAELVTEVLTIQANIQAEKVTQIKPTDYRALIDATRDLADTLEFREQCKPSFMPDGGFFRSPEDVMFDHEMKTAMERSQGRVLTSQSERELAKALALSQAMDEERQFERDMALAMAMSTVENGTGDQELDSLLASKW
jgi:hypothetical protein